MRTTCILVFALALLATGCKKENNQAPAVPKIKTAILPDLINGVTDTLHYTYNNDGTINEVKYGSGLARRTYIYSGNTITEVFYNFQGALTSTSIYFKNSEGYVDSLYYASADYRYSYQHDSKGFKTKESFRGPTNNISSIYTFVNDGKNVTHLYSADGNGTIGGSSTYTYFTDKRNTIGNANTGMAFLGADGSNPVSTTVVSNSSGVNTYTSTYDYDSEGRITARYFHGTGGAVIGNNTYIYY